MADIYFTNSDGKRVAVSAANPLPTSGGGGGGGPVDWEDVENKPSEFPPTSHTHAIANVTGLQDALDGKQASGSYAAASHTHAAGDVDSGTFSTARIPALAISKITGLQAKIDEIEGRLDALENPEDPEP